MINGKPVSISEGTICDHPDDATVVEYDSEEALNSAYQEANPDLFPEEELEPLA